MTLLFEDLKLQKVLNGGSVLITFNEKGDKCKINDHIMKKCHLELKKSGPEGVFKRYSTKLWGETVYFEIVTNQTTI